ncbi:MAG: hypothetical protein OEW08_13765 [Gammaproteobacteria bacterium]|nr:hypothetical protein [Gammaproteobacteria bacterium]
MIGKKNVVFGFIFLVFTAALGPLMVRMYTAVGETMGEKQTTVGRLQQLQAANFEEDLEPLGADKLAKANTAGILTLNKLVNHQFEIDLIKGGPHTHGNLEALLNIVVGIALCFIGVSARFKQLISWMFIVGTVFHSGMLYLGRVLHLSWAETLLNTGIGPVLILLGLLLMGIAAARGFDARLVRD